MPQKPARRAYSAEELLALRRSASDEPALTIKKKAEDGAIRDHVLRGSRFGGPRSASSALPRELLRVPPDTRNIFAGPVLGEIDPNNQRIRMSAIPSDSPSASLKKKKAEQILKQHGSPPGIRVTAGGRIVPSEQSPLCSPRYGYSAVQKNGGLIKFAPGYPPPPKSFSNYARSLPNGWVLQDPSGILVQVVDGRLLAIQDVDGIPQLYITAPNLDNAAWAKFHDAQENVADETAPPKSDASSKAESMKGPSVPSVSEQLSALEKQYQKLESERRSLDKTEVLKRSELTGGAYTQLVQKRRELIERQDEVRRSIKALKDSITDTKAAVPETTKSAGESMLPQFAMPSPFIIQGQMPYDPSVTGLRMPLMMPAGPDQVPFFVPQPFYPGGGPPLLPYGPYMSHVGQMSTTALNSTSTDMGHAPFLPFFNPGSAHISENEKDIGLRPGSAGQRSGLNPMSPIYEPNGSKPASPEKKRAHPFSHDLDNSVIITTQHGRSAKSQASRDNRSTHNSSEASYATADFFPHNPRDHSLHKDAYPFPSGRGDVVPRSLTTHQSNSHEAIAQPEMERHNPNWNPTIPDQAFQKSPFSDHGHLSNSKVSQTHRMPATTGNVGGQEFAAGYRAGLIRAAIGNEQRSKDWFDGYCKGLLESVDHTSAVSEDDPNKLIVKLPNNDSSGPPPVKVLKLDSVPRSGSSRVSSKPALRSLKDFVNSPENENALLSPHPEGPHVDAIQGKSLGAWSKENSSRSAEDAIAGASASVRANIDSENSVATTDFAQTRMEPSELISGHRAFSAQVPPTRDLSASYFHRAYGAHRVLSSPMDWKSANSVAQVAGLANGYFAQFDGTSSKPASKAPGTDDANNEKTAAAKFKEATMTQDEPISPSKLSNASSPKKSVSPAKAKFAAIAGKAGIKVRTDRPQPKESNDMDHLVPRERRPWRYVWKGRNNASD
ncbi:Hypothetical protein D9617_3g018250 [Elsinoe fawcettii]|nr:Hypothetical protein D9617_3g018250 [Elsinoe fawcettii]